MREWIIELTGKEADLERLVGLRDSDAGWRVERDDRRGVILRSSRLDALEDRSEVRQAAANLVSFVDIAARLSVHRFGGVALADCVLILDGQEQFAGSSSGNVGHQVLPALTQKAYGAGVGPPRTPDGPPPSPREFEHWEILQRLKLLSAYPDLADALRYMNEEPDLRGYYKVGEAILRALGRPKKWEIIAKLGWASDDEVRRFTGSAQIRRHHALPGPDKPMTDSEARAFVRDLLDKLIAHLDSSTP